MWTGVGLSCQTPSSGPSSAAFVDPARAHEIAAAMPAGGRASVLDIAEEGATMTTGTLIAAMVALKFVLPQ